MKYGWIEFDGWNVITKEPYEGVISCDSKKEAIELAYLLTEIEAEMTLEQIRRQNDLRCNKK